VTDPGSRVTVTREDIEHAQDVLDAWVDHLGHLALRDQVWHESTPYLRGLVTQAIADARAIGYTRGRQQIGDRLHDLLDEEDLV